MSINLHGAVISPGTEHAHLQQQRTPSPPVDGSPSSDSLSQGSASGSDAPRLSTSLPPGAQLTGSASTSSGQPPAQYAHAGTPRTAGFQVSEEPPSQGPGGESVEYFCEKLLAAGSTSSLSTDPYVAGEGADGTHEIYLPYQHEDVSLLGLDLGGSLSKVVYFSRRRNPNQQPAVAPALLPGGDYLPAGGRLHFERFATHDIHRLVQFLRPFVAACRRAAGLPPTRDPSSQGDGDIIELRATGGGAHKFSQLFLAELGVRLVACDEMLALIRGLNFLLREVPCEVFSLREREAGAAAASGAVEDLGSDSEEEDNIDAPPQVRYHPAREHPATMYPYLLVNIGSGVSLLLVTGPDSFQRVGGTSLGGGTLWGLLSLLTDCVDFDSMLSLSMRGDNRNVDMLVGDIYGADYTAVGLKATTIASSFGKVWQPDSPGAPASCTHSGSAAHAGPGGTFGEDAGHEAGDASAVGPCSHACARRRRFSPADLAKSALLMVANNIGQIAYLTAQAHNINTIYFGGSFLRGHAATLRSISSAVAYWSGGQVGARFLRHDGYLGALGAFLEAATAADAVEAQALALGGLHQGSSGGVSGFQENFSPRSGGGPAVAPAAPPTAIRLPHRLPALGVLERAAQPLVSFPLLRKRSSYRAATLDLAAITPAADILRRHWLAVFRRLVERVSRQTLQALTNSRLAAANGAGLTATQQRLASQLPRLPVMDLALVQGRCDAFERSFTYLLDRLEAQPAAYGWLSIASLLNLQEQCLHEFVAADPLINLKLHRNLRALSLLPQHIDPKGGPPTPAAECAEWLAAGLAAASNVPGIGETEALGLVRAHQPALLAWYGWLASGLCRLLVSDRASGSVELSAIYDLADDWTSETAGDAFSASVQRLREQLMFCGTDAEDPPASADEQVSAPLRLASLAGRSLLLGLSTGRWKRVIICVNNAGACAVLGALPFARLLLSYDGPVLGATSASGASTDVPAPVVYLAANSYPASDDITCHELQSLLQLATEDDPDRPVDPVLRGAFHSERLQVIPTGTGGTCLSLARVSSLLSEIATPGFVPESGSTTPRGPPTPRAPAAVSSTANATAASTRADSQPDVGPMPPAPPITLTGPSLASATPPRETSDTLLILLGAGRALHTNLLASFNCDVLKVAVVKDASIAVSCSLYADAWFRSNGGPVGASSATTGPAVGNGGEQPGNWAFQVGDPFVAFEDFGLIDRLEPNLQHRATLVNQAAANEIM